MAVADPRSWSVRTRWIAVVAALAVVSMIPSILGFDGYVARPGDLLAFWASSRALLDGLNPYDPAALGEILTTVNSTFSNAPEVYYPPWLFTLIWWFGLLGARTFATVWLFTMLAAFVVTTYWAIRHFRYLRPGTASHRAVSVRAHLLFLLTFYPFLRALDLGQLTPIVLVGLVGFIAFRGRSDKRPEVIAGLALAVAAFKPQLIYLVYVDLVVQSLRHRRFAVLGALAGGFGAMCALPLLLDPGIYADFLAHDTGAASRWFTPTIAGVIKSLTGTTSTVWWFLPTVVGLAAGITFAVRTPEPATTELRDRRLLLLTCFSLLTAPYAWTYDFLVLLPAGLFLVSKTLHGRLIGGLPVGTLVLVAANLVMFGSGDSLEFRVWYPAFFAAMLWLTNRASQSAPVESPITSGIRRD